VTDKKRLELAARCANLVRARIDANGGRYDGTAAPNLQSVIDLATADARFLVGVEDGIAALEREVLGHNAAKGDG
jgi:hypothetical protein